MKKSGVKWGELIAGVLLTALGAATFADPDGMLAGAVAVYGAIAVIMGIEDIIVYARIARFTGLGPMLSLISGILSVMCGIMLMANPNAGIWVLTVLLPVWFLAHCISGLTRLGFVRLMGSTFYYWFLLVLDITGIVLSFMMLFNPAVSLLTVRALSYFAAAYLVLFGTESVISAFVRRNSSW